MRDGRIAVVGAGPAGLIAGLVARKLDLPVVVFEQAPDFKQIGGGIALQSNGQRVLEALGLLDSFRPMMVLCPAMAIESPTGNRFMTVDMSKVAPSVPHSSVAVVLRYQLQEHLLAAVQERGGTVLFGHRCLGVSVINGVAKLRFDNGNEYECDVVIACDGIHSPTRESIGLKARRQRVRQAYLRGVAHHPTAEPIIRELWAPDGRLFGIAPLPQGMSYFYCSAPIGRWTETLHGDLDQWIASWERCGPDVMAILRAVPDWQHVTYDELHEVRLRHWSKPPVFLAGDAAHAMTPYLGQGANSAMVDSLVLMQLVAKAFKTGVPLEEVRRIYETLRRPFVSRIQAAARQYGLVATLSFSPARSVRNRILPLLLKAPWLGNRTQLLGMGYSPKEEPYFDI